MIIALVWLHFLADFVMQTDKMALNKSKSLKWLSIHVLVYSLPFLVFGWRFALVTFFFHFVTDFFTSKGTAILWAAGERHYFFVLIGFDQAIHITTLFLTYYFLVAIPQGLL